MCAATRRNIVYNVANNWEILYSEESISLYVYMYIHISDNIDGRCSGTKFFITYLDENADTIFDNMSFVTVIFIVMNIKRNWIHKLCDATL